MLRLGGCEVGKGGKGSATPFAGDFLSALIDLSGIPHFAYGFDLLAFKVISRRLSCKLLSWLDIVYFEGDGSSSG